MTFGKNEVKNFGFTKKFDQLPEGMTGQVSIFDYKSPNDFIISLKTKSPDDQLILAKVVPGTTLEAMIADVLKRTSNNKPVTPISGDTLAVPKLNFDLRRDFSELEGLILVPSPAAHIKSKMVIAKAEQLVRFQMNEKGAVLKSEAVIVMKALAIYNPNPPKVMRFDKPFLILMKQANSNVPYFALWVGNASLLMPADKK